MGIFIAIPIVMSGRADVLALATGLQFGEWLGLAVVGGLALCAVSRRRQSQRMRACADDAALRPARPLDDPLQHALYASFASSTWSGDRPSS